MFTSRSFMALGIALDFWCSIFYRVIFFILNGKWFFLFFYSVDEKLSWLFRYSKFAGERNRVESENIRANKSWKIVWSNAGKLQSSERRGDQCLAFYERVRKKWFQDTSKWALCTCVFWKFYSRIFLLHRGDNVLLMHSGKREWKI